MPLPQHDAEIASSFARGELLAMTSRRAQNFVPLQHKGLNPPYPLPERVRDLSLVRARDRFRKGVPGFLLAQE